MFDKRIDRLANGSCSKKRFRLHENSYSCTYSFESAILKKKSSKNLNYPRRVMKQFSNIDLKILNSNICKDILVPHSTSIPRSRT